MAISKADATKRRRLSTEEEFKRQEEMIDKHLCKGMRTFGLRHVPMDVCDRIVEAYRLAGWDVQLVFDQRDGNYLQFS